MRIAAEEKPEDYGSDTPENEAATEVGWKGAAAQSAGIALESRAKIAQKAAARR